VKRRGGTPLLDIDLLRGTPGYASGALLGTVYFAGFSGVWLVFALYFQTGLDYTPLRSGLSVTPFAIGSACSAVIGGRLVARWGRRLTVLGLALVVLGVGVTAVVLAVAPGPSAGYLVALPLLVGGIGGGWVVAPNTTMTLRCVPVAMAGSAGGALQTGQRIGAAVGSAALPGVYYAMLAATGRDLGAAVAVSLGIAVVALTVALAVAVGEVRAERRRPPAAETEHEREHVPDAH
jgi:MFS family permease